MPSTNNERNRNEFDYTSLINESQSNVDVDVIHHDDNILNIDCDDKYKLVRITFCLLGLAQLLPWNFFITATDYWMFKFRDVDGNQSFGGDANQLQDSNKSPLQLYFDSYLSIGSNVPFLVVLVLNAFYGQKLSPHVRNLVSLNSTILIFILTTTFVKINTDSWQDTFFAITLVIIVLLSFFAGFLQGSVSGLATVFPSGCMHSMISGQAISGLFAVVAQLISLSSGLKATDSAFYYFLFADITLVATLILYLFVQKSKYYQLHVHKLSIIRTRLDSLPSSHFIPRQRPLFSILRFMWPHAISVMLVFWTTLSLYPAVTVLVVPRHPESSLWTGRYFLPLACFLLFNMSDFFGRILANLMPLPSKREYVLLFLATLRTVLIPLIMLCDARPRFNLPVIFENEVYYIAFMTLLGLSNGYVFSNAMIHGPMFVSSEFREKAGFILVAFLGIGLTLGSLTSNILIRLL